MGSHYSDNEHQSINSLKSSLHSSNSNISIANASNGQVELDWMQLYHHALQQAAVATTVHLTTHSTYPFSSVMPSILPSRASSIQSTMTNPSNASSSNNPNIPQPHSSVTSNGNYTLSPSLMSNRSNSIQTTALAGQSKSIHPLNTANFVSVVPHLTSFNLTNNPTTNNQSDTVNNNCLTKNSIPHLFFSGIPHNMIPHFSGSSYQAPTTVSYPPSYYTNKFLQKEQTSISTTDTNNIIMLKKGMMTLNENSVMKKTNDNMQVGGSQKTISKATNNHRHIEKYKNDKVSLRLSQETPTKENKVKRPPNAFMLYRSDKFKELREKYRGVNSTQFSRDIAKSWENEPESVKEKYRILSNEMRVAHSIKHPDSNYLASSLGLNKRRHDRKSSKKKSVTGGGMKKMKAIKEAAQEGITKMNHVQHVNNFNEKDMTLSPLEMIGAASVYDDGLDSAISRKGSLFLFEEDDDLASSLYSLESCSSSQYIADFYCTPDENGQSYTPLSHHATQTPTQQLNLHEDDYVSSLESMSNSSYAFKSSLLWKNNLGLLESSEINELDDAINNNKTNDGFDEDSNDELMIRNQRQVSFYQPSHVSDTFEAWKELDEVSHLAGIDSGSIRQVDASWYVPFIKGLKGKEQHRIMEMISHHGNYHGHYHQNMSRTNTATLSDLMESSPFTSYDTDLKAKPSDNHQDPMMMEHATKQHEQKHNEVSTSSVHRGMEGMQVDANQVIQSWLSQQHRTNDDDHEDRNRSENNQNEKSQEKRKLMDVDDKNDYSPVRRERKEELAVAVAEHHQNNVNEKKTNKKSCVTKDDDDMMRIEEIMKI